MRLQIKILLLFLLVGGLPLTIIGGYSLFRVEKTIRASTHQNLLSLGTEVGKEIQRTVNEGYNAMHLLAENPVLLSRAATREALSEELAKTFRFYPIIQDLTLINPDGHVRASVKHSFRGTWSSTNWFQQAMTGNSLLSEVHALIYPYQVVMTVAIPVFDTGDRSVRNVLIGQIKMGRVWEIIADVSFGTNGRVLLVDRRGLVVACSDDHEQILRPVPIEGLSETIFERGQGVFRALDPQGRDMVSAFVPVDQHGSERISTGWYVVLVQPAKDAYDTVSQLRQGLIWTGLTSFAAVIVLGTLFSRQISRRVLSLVAATRSLGRGAFGLSLGDLGKDEIGELGRAFNQASRQLADSDREIKAYQENLHGLVEQRTQELLSSNAKLMQEIEERKKIEDVRERLEAQLRQSQKMDAVGTLAGGIAHDFNNMLQGMSSHVQLMLLRSDAGPMRESLGKVEQIIARASDLVRRLLTFSRRAEAKRTRIDLNMEVENVSALLQRTLPRMIRIETRLDPDLHPISADPVQVEQVLVNLAGNARDAMPQGGILTIETLNTFLDEEHAKEYPGLSPGPHVLLKVTDTGCGMDDEIREHIFEPFFTTKGVGKGTGLGLAMVYGIVKDHNGHIVCKSKPGQGTTFSILLPAMDRHAVKAHEGETPAKRDLTKGMGTILVVDDEDMIREVTRELLTSFGYTVYSAASGEEALGIYSSGEADIDLVITDLGMPGMGGAALLSELLKIDPKAKVIVASGYAATKEDKRLRRAAGFITKPYTLDCLLDMVRRVLDVSQKAGQS